MGPLDHRMSCEPGPPGTLSLLPLGRVDHLVRLATAPWFWEIIYSLEITSNECLSEVRSLLNCPSKIAVARNFRGSEAQAFVDFLDKVSRLYVLWADN